MSSFSLKAQPAPAPDLKQEMQSAIVEMIFAGHALTKYLTWSEADTQECVCGTLAGTSDNPDNHHNSCPVARFYAAVEAVRKAVLIALFAVIVLAKTCSGQDTQARKPVSFDRTDWALFSADVSARTLDTVSTRLILTDPCGCYHEDILPPAITNHTATLIGFEAGMIGFDWLVYRTLRVHRHPALARAVFAVDASAVIPTAVHNFMLLENPPSVQISLRLHGKVAR